MSEAEFRPEAILEALNRESVRFILIGGFAAVIHGSRYVTTDLDIVPEKSSANLARLSLALRDLDARMWASSEPQGIAFAHDADALARVRTWRLITRHGRLGIAFDPSGTAGFPDLRRGAVGLTVLGADVAVASLADVIGRRKRLVARRTGLCFPRCAG